MMLKLKSILQSYLESVFIFLLDNAVVINKKVSNFLINVENKKIRKKKYIYILLKILAVLIRKYQLNVVRANNK